MRVYLLLSVMLPTRRAGGGLPGDSCRAARNQPLAPAGTHSPVSGWSVIFPMVVNSKQIAMCPNSLGSTSLPLRMVPAWPASRRATSFSASTTRLTRLSALISIRTGPRRRATRTCCHGWGAGLNPNTGFELRVVDHPDGRYIRERGFDKRYYEDLILALVREHGPVGRSEIDQALNSKLPDRLTHVQKRSWVSNLTNQAGNET